MWFQVHELSHQLWQCQNNLHCIISNETTSNQILLEASMLSMDLNKLNLTHQLTLSTVVVTIYAWLGRVHTVKIWWEFSLLSSMHIYVLTVATQLSSICRLTKPMLLYDVCKIYLSVELHLVLCTFLDKIQSRCLVWLRRVWWYPFYGYLQYCAILVISGYHRCSVTLVHSKCAF